MSHGMKSAMIPSRVPLPGRWACLLLWMALLAVPAGAEKNLLPRLPELVIEKGYSDAFEVLECIASTEVVGETAHSSLKVVLKNVSGKPVASSLKIRALYLMGAHGATLKVNGKPQRYDRQNPRLSVSLAPEENLTVDIEARQNILYNLDALKKEPEANSRSSGEKTGSRFALDDFRKFFGRENFGRRLLVGPLVSKWGIFPVTFRQVRLEIRVPREFEGILPEGSSWQRTERSNTQVFRFEGIEGFNGAVFLPKQDAPAFRQMQDAARPATGATGLIQVPGQ